jgi:class 3 adenylate cyclase/putative methionine-R-sulfoxide reductase with GAF domain
MKRRSRAGGETIKGRRRKTPEPKRRNASANASSSKLTKDAEIARLSRELDKALEQQIATSKVLQLISASSGDLQPIFDEILQNATRICEANFGVLLLFDGKNFRVPATHNAPPEFVEFRRRHPIIRSSGVLQHVISTKQLLHISDCRDDASHRLGSTDFIQFVKLCSVRTLLTVPMLRGSELIGCVGIYRREVRPFIEKQIALAQNFAAQAVIAIENARLLNELHQRTMDLTEALEQQTATSDVLKVVSGSPGELKPVFDAMLESATRICDATFGAMLLRDGDAYRRVALHNAPQKFSEYSNKTPILRPGIAPGLDRVIHTRRVVHIRDLEAENPDEPIVKFGGARTILGVPMLKENEAIGVIAIYRQELRPFTDKQIELVKNFAAQAVIAIENARLLNELRQRTDDLSQRTTDLTEALEQQTATSEVLQVISSSPGDLEPVFATMLEKAVRLCDATFGNIYRWDGEFLNLVATHNTPPAFLEVRRSLRIAFGPKDPVGRMITNKNVVHIADLTEEQDYIERSNPGVVAAVELGGIRTHVVVPMLKDDELIGTFHLSRQEVRPFTDKQIELVTNFAAQAVIAIENTRLLKELRERTEEVEKLNQHLEQRVTDQVDEIERMSRLRRFLPPQVADLIVASGSEKQLESHRREITALFCDLRGFTGFTESADAEDVMVLLREYHSALGEKIIKYSGTLERYAGDGVMVVFNDPVPVENPALQAVLMALEMREAIGALTETWRRWGHEIGFGIGIAHGFATLGTIGFEGRFDYAAIGTVSNVASRLCDEAKPGQILISPRVLTKVENAVRVERVGEFELKGIRRPLAAYNVIGTA